MSRRCCPSLRPQVVERLPIVTVRPGVPRLVPRREKAGEEEQQQGGSSSRPGPGPGGSDGPQDVQLEVEFRRSRVDARAAGSGAGRAYTPKFPKVRLWLLAACFQEVPPRFAARPCLPLHTSHLRTRHRP
jgi:hypothetical protein